MDEDFIQNHLRKKRRHQSEELDHERCHQNFEDDLFVGENLLDEPSETEADMLGKHAVFEDDTLAGIALIELVVTSQCRFFLLYIVDQQFALVLVRFENRFVLSILHQADDRHRVVFDQLIYRQFFDRDAKSLALRDPRQDLDGGLFPLFQRELLDDSTAVYIDMVETSRYFQCYQCCLHISLSFRRPIRRQSLRKRDRSPAV